MASERHMPVPVCLVENRPAEGLVVRQEALRVLSEVTQPVVVAGIAGLYRTGKSYLMNRLAGQRRGFSLGASVQSHTKGIWLWCVPHPRRPGHTLVLLDTEGLGDVQKGDSRNDTWIFVLTVLLSSTLIYNSKGIIDQHTMEQLHYVVTLSEKIKLKAAPKKSADELDDSEKFALFFPNFVWAVRDFTLDLEVNGEEISEDEYLENALKLKAGSGPETQHHNELRECLRQFFPCRKCFVFDQPATRRQLAHLEELQDEELSPEFLQQVEKFCSHIWENSPPKTTLDGHIVTGTSLGKLAEIYVEAIRSGAVPCVESVMLALAEIENRAAVKEAVTLYQGLMKEQAKLPTETMQELLELHTRCEQKALDQFMERAFKDGIWSFQAELIWQVEAVKVRFCQDNEQASRAKCEAALRDLSQAVERRVSAGAYSVSGGYELFRRDQQALVEKYQELPGKGVMAGAVLQEFLQSRKTLAKAILDTDCALTAKDRELRFEQDQCERAEWEREVQRMKEAEDKQKKQSQLHSRGEHTLRLRKKLEDCSERQLEVYRRIIGYRSEEESMLLQDGFHERAIRQRTVIHTLQEECHSTTSRILHWVQVLVPVVLGLAFVVLRLL
ncbi:guanylate-binding protein 1-like isoform X1 [Phalacrocorax carbo]|uniref:guanylate-binding protein 1-like isoform X1 n=1 Tax=Phalacrocorax carbo TaxID=9209 RepID=UPI00311A535D